MSLQINLFNPAFEKTKNFFAAQTMLQAFVLLLLGMLGLGLYAQRSVGELEKQATAVDAQLQQSRARHASAQVQFAPRRKSAELEQALDEAQRKLGAMQDVVGVLNSGKLGNTDGYSAYFSALARQRTGELWLTGVAITGAGNSIGLQGRALDPALVPAYITRLTHEPVMQGMSFGSLQISRLASTDKGANGLAPFVDFSLQSAPVESK